MAEKSPARSPWFWVWLGIGGWTTLALLAGVEMYIAQLYWDKPVSWALAMRRAFKEMYSYGVLSVGVFWFCSRMPLQPGGRWPWIGFHMLGALVFSQAHLALVSWLQAGEISVQTGKVLTFTYLYSKLIVNYTISNLIKYWLFVLGHLGWQYYQRYRERERAAAALTTELVQARLQALRMQINPHFLFNTLNTIASLVRENPDAAERMIVRLSKLLRETLDRGDVQEVPLREEIEFLKSYLEIEQMRFSDRLTVKFDIETKATDLFVPHLILQPLVENALRHGIMPREEAGRIEISARLVGWGERPHEPLPGGNETARPEPRPTRESQLLELLVHDNGNGLNATNGSNGREGIGLKNVRSRLAQLYGEAQEFTLVNAAGGGVEARLRIPCCPIPRTQAPQAVVMSATEASEAGLPLPLSAAAKPKCW